MIQGMFWKMGQKRIHEPEDFIVTWCLLVTLEVTLVKSHPHVHPNVSRRCQQTCPTPGGEVQEINPIQRTKGNWVKPSVADVEEHTSWLSRFNGLPWKQTYKCIWIQKVIFTYIHACSNHERKDHAFEGGEKAWKGCFSGKKRNGKHNYIIISKITLNRAKENAKLKSNFF